MTQSPATGTGKSQIFYTHNTWILYTIGAIFVIVRLTVKCYLQRRLGAEELLMIGALVFWTTDTSLITVILTHGTNQLQYEDQRIVLTKAEIKQRTIGSKSFIIAWFMYTTAIWCCKFSVVMFYNTIEKHMAYFTCLLLATYGPTTYVACIITLLTICMPFKNNWQVFPDPGRRCTDGKEYVEVLNIFTDLILLVLPMPLLMTLKISPGRRILLIILFGLSAFVIIATILRIYFSVSGGSIANVAFWSEIETSTLFIVSNSPGIKPIFSRFKSKVTSRGQKQSYELSSRHKNQRKHDRNRGISNGTVTKINSSDGDSTENICPPANKMVIVKNTTYDVKVESAHDYEDEVSRQRYSARFDVSSGLGALPNTSESSLVGPAHARTPTHGMED